MTAKQAWGKLIKHCRYLGIPIKYGKSNKVFQIDGNALQILAKTGQQTGWEKNFQGAWDITFYLPKNGKITWSRVALLIHEIGHVLDFRDNMVLERHLVHNERTANKYGLKIAELLGVHREKIKPSLDFLVDEYRQLLKKDKKDA